MTRRERIAEKLLWLAVIASIAMGLGWVDNDPAMLWGGLAAGCGLALTSFLLMMTVPGRIR